MGFRFRRSFKVLPGVRLNISKSGASMSLGKRGAWVTLGNKGVRTTIRIPGTGISYTTLRLGPGQHKQTVAPAVPQRLSPWKPNTWKASPSCAPNKCGVWPGRTCSMADHRQERVKSGSAGCLR